MPQSQLGEDYYAYQTFFGHVRNGTFVELGALDGEIFSNTKLFEDYLGWTGVLLEANPLLFPYLCARRVCSERINVAICDPASIRPRLRGNHRGRDNTYLSAATTTVTTVHYVQPVGVVSWWGVSGAAALGAIEEFMSPTFRAQFYGNKTKRIVLPVQCHSLKNVLRLLGVTHVDFLSVDVEGAELSVLQTLDFTEVSVDVAVVELDGRDRHKDDAVKQLLARSGFLVHGATRQNTWFVREGTEYTHRKCTLDPNSL
jgi:hypothetical protein